MNPHLSGAWVLLMRYGLYFAFAWAAVYWRRWQKRHRESIAQDWPSVEAVIISGHVSPIPKTSCFLATLQYTYFIEEYRTGKYVHEFPREIDADDFVRQLANTRLQIRYNQSNPDNSVLEQSVIEQHFVLAPRFN